LDLEFVKPLIHHKFKRQEDSLADLPF